MGIKKNAIGGAKWTGTSKLGAALLQFGQIVILGRILSPEDFGLMSMVMVVIGFTQAYMDMGISNAIISIQNSTKRQLSSVYWLNIFAGVILFLVLNSASSLIQAFYKEPRLEDLVFLASFVFLITPIGQQFYVLLQKELRFKLLAIFEILSYSVGIVTSIILALKGFGVYSLIWGQIVSVSIRTLFTAYIGFNESPPGFEFKYSEIKEYINFGLYQMGEKSLNFFSKNVDYLLIGRYFGADILGAYTIAFQLIIIPVQKINPILTTVAFPLFSKYKNNNEILRNAYFTISKFLTFVSYPGLMFLAVTSHLIIPVLFGEGWDLTIKLVPIMVIIGLIRSLGNPAGSIYLAKGKADVGFYFNLFIAASNLIAFWIASKFSVYHVAWTFSIMNILYFLTHRYVVDKMLKSNWIWYLKPLWKNILISLVSSIFVFFIQDFLEFKMNMKLIFSILIMGVFYFGLQFIFNKNYLNEIYYNYLR
ncbi:MOP flippase family protein [Psychroflexus sp. CAK1W]|uniref:MOP flippase family protein n=1 Tax=Psychroflexus curvus TaxID=2873595 RepID=UPI001CCF60E8|nr:MOP flippase family protein [Psychroflexus curvus]MBZ9629077.1 MOP flippase family protein [Psychroflexus curvus]